MDKLGFYPLTLILSYLHETDGTCLLSTKRYYAKQILPMFRDRVNAGLVVVNAPRKHRHRFQISPVQEPVLLLQRLNTRRLGKRRRRLVPCTAMSTAEIAGYEWNGAYKEFSNEKQTEFQFPYPPPLELLRFLDQTSESAAYLGFLKQSVGISLLISYPRSGNTLLRTILERTTGIVTGSDTRPDRSLSKALAEAHNLVGEGLTQRSKTCFVKTHWPERVGLRVFEGQRAILVVRNPYDAIDSYWNLNVTNTHTETVTDEVYARFGNKFEQLAKNEMQVWCEYHRYWLEKSRKEGFPLLIIRFENLIQRPDVELSRIFQFLVKNKEQRLHPFWQRRIAHATTTTTQHNTLGSYTPRTATRGVQSIGKSLHKGRYSPQLLDYFHAVAAKDAAAHGDDDLLKYFGYHIFDQDFPQNFVLGTAPDVEENDGNTALSIMRVNSGSLVRPRNCPFGRDMRNWRLRHTNNDTEPFPRVTR